MQAQHKPQLTLFARLTIGQTQHDIPIQNTNEAAKLQNNITGLLDKREAAMVVIEQVDTALIALCRGEVLPVEALTIIPATLSEAVNESIVNLRSNIQAEIERPLESKRNDSAASPDMVDLVCSNPECRRPFTREAKTLNRNKNNLNHHNWCSHDCSSIGWRLLQKAAKEAKKQAKEQAKEQLKTKADIEQPLAVAPLPLPTMADDQAGFKQPIVCDEQITPEATPVSPVKVAATPPTKRVRTNECVHIVEIPRDEDPPDWCNAIDCQRNKRDLERSTPKNKYGQTAEKVPAHRGW